MRFLLLYVALAPTEPVPSSPCAGKDIDLAAAVRAEACTATEIKRSDTEHLTYELVLPQKVTTGDRVTDGELRIKNRGKNVAVFFLDPPRGILAGILPVPPEDTWEAETLNARGTGTYYPVFGNVLGDGPWPLGARHAPCEGEGGIELRVDGIAPKVKLVKIALAPEGTAHIPVHFAAVETSSEKDQSTRPLRPGTYMGALCVPFVGGPPTMVSALVQVEPTKEVRAQEPAAK